MLSSPAPASKSSNIKCFKFLGKGQIAFQFSNKRSMIMQKDEIVDNARSRDESLSKHMEAIMSTLRAQGWWMLENQKNI
ncbi:hypothetical protein CR513_04198, partial [Mucuna pruriens]